MENKNIILDENAIGLYIPHNELIKRKKYNWYCYLNFEQVLKCNVFMSHYMVSISGKDLSGKDLSGKDLSKCKDLSDKHLSESKS